MSHDKSEAGKLKVLLLLHELSRTGAPKIAIESLQLLQDQVDVMAISLQRGEMEGAVTSFAQLHVLPEPSHHQDNNRKKTLLERYAARRERDTWRTRFETWQPDVIYANSVASLPVAHYVAVPQAPVLLHVHELDMFIAWYDRMDPYRLRRWPARYIAVADAVKQVLVGSFGIAPDKIASIPEFFDDVAIDASLQKSAALAAAQPAHAGPYVVGGAGRIGWRKGFELWLQTAVYLADKLGRENIRFEWVGAEDDLREFEMRLTARKLGVDDIVSILPMTRDPFPSYSRFDTFLMTSWEDPFPIVVLEAMGMGKPVVCIRNSGGPAEQVAETGIVVERFDAKLLGDAICTLRDNPTYAAQLGDAARVRARTHFTKSAVVPRILEELRATAGMK